MVNRILLFILVFASSFSFSQEDTLFPNVDASWNIKTSTNSGQGNAYGGYELYMTSDTILYQGMDWRLLTGSAWFYVRQDSGKIYSRIMTGPLFYTPYHSYNDTGTVLLYDFNKVAGDTAYMTPAGVGTAPVIVDNVGYSTILGVSRKTLYLDNGEKWIAGMGSDYGFMYPALTHFEVGTTLLCFTGEYEDSLQSSYSLQYEGSINGCSLSYEPLEMNAPQVSMRCSGYKLEVELAGPETIEVYSYSGKKVFSMALGPGDSSVDLSFLERGAYIIRIGSFTERFIRT